MIDAADVFIGKGLRYRRPRASRRPGVITHVLVPPAAPSIGMHRNFPTPGGPRSGAMNPPTRAMLAVFRASLRLMDDETLGELRGRFATLGEHPAGIRVIDREIARRKRAGS
jgi:hypothetical protein